MLVKLDFVHSVFGSLVTDWFSTSQLQPANHTFLKGEEKGAASWQAKSDLL